jgi:sugar lactone lactonase YvrE
VAVDDDGNVYVCDTYNNRVLKETPSGTGYIQSIVADQTSGGLNEPWGVAVDASGNVYIADQQNSRVVKEAPSANGYVQSIVAADVYEASLVAVDRRGNVYTSPAGLVTVILKETPSGGSYIQSTVVTGAADPQGLAVDGSGNLYLAEYYADKVVKVPWNGSTFGAPVPVGGDTGGGVVGVAVDPAGDVFFTNPTINQVSEVPRTGSGYGPQIELDTPGVGSPYGPAVDAKGNLYFADDGQNRVVKLGPGGATMNSVKVGGVGQPVTVIFTFDTGGELSAATPYQVLTQGVPNLDFKDAGGSTCAANTTYSAGDFCYVNVRIEPRLAGSRYGAVNLYGSSGDVIATGYVYGAGVAPQISFLPGTESKIPTGGLSSPNGVAVDGGGNIYLADSNDGSVLKETPSTGGLTRSTIVSGLTKPAGLAVDGSGSVYIASWGGSHILKETWTGSNYSKIAIGSSISDANAVAVDGSGNVYVADTGNGRVLLETLASGSYTQSVVITAGTGSFSGDPSGVAVDASGNLFVTSYNNSQILELSPAGSGYSQTLVGSGLSGPSGIAVDESGVLYATDTQNNRVLRESPWNGGYIQSEEPSSALDSPSSVAVDTNRNLYISDTNHQRVLKEDLADPPSLTFAPTPVATSSSDSPQTVTFFNAGNAPLTFSGEGITYAFPEKGGEDPGICNDAVILSAADACNLPISFVPTKTGELSGILTMYDNALNVTGAQQTITLSGRGLAGAAGATHFSITSTSVASVSAGTPFTIAVTALNGRGHTATTYDGTVSFTSSDPEFVNPGLLTLAAGVGQTTVNLQTAGIQTITATDTANALLTSLGPFNVPAASVISLSSSAASENFGAQAVGSASGATMLTFSIAASTTVGSIAVVTTGTENLDFTNTGGGTCAAENYAMSSTCTVGVQFKPVAPGVRMGAVVFFSQAGNTGTVLGQALIYGTGLGAQIGFAPSPATASSSEEGLAWLAFVGGIAVDAAGNQFVASPNYQCVVEFPAGGGAPFPIFPVVNGEGLSFPVGVAVDGAGDLFIADSDKDRVVEVPAGGGTPIAMVPSANGATLQDPAGMVVDGTGDLYIADPGSNHIFEVPSGGGPPAAISPVVDGKGLYYPSDLAVDGAGDLFIADENNNRVVEVPSGGGTPLAIAPSVNGIGLKNPGGVAVDAAGNLFISDIVNNRVVERPITGGSAVAIDPVVNGTPLHFPTGLRLDGSGNLYVADYWNWRVVELQRSLPLALNFPNTTLVGTVDTTDGKQTMQVQNLGNTSLNLSLSYPEDFPEATGDASACTDTSSLAAGKSCDLPIEFVPQEGGPLEEQIVLADNALNVSGAQQSVAVSGNGEEPVPPSMTSPAPGSTLSGTVVFQWNGGFGSSAFMLKVGTNGAGSSNLYKGGSTTATSVTVDNIPTDGRIVYVQLGYEVGTTWTFTKYKYVEYSPPPFGALGLAGDSVTFSSTVSQADSLEVRGWVADLVDGAPLTNVKVFVDGTLAGTPTLGIARPDIAASQNNIACLYSGYEFLYPVTALTPGLHVVTVVAVDSLGKSTTFGPVNFSVAAAAGVGDPFGGIGAAVDNTTLSATVGQGDSLEVSGWVADPQDGAPLSNVTVYIDGTLAGTPTLGIARPDIARAYRSTYTNSGYQFLYSAASLSLATHQVTVIAVDSGGRSKTFGPVAFTVAATAGAGPPLGSIGEAVDSTTFSSTVSPSDSLEVKGWVADPTDGAPLSNVKVYIDGAFVGTPTLGLPRPEVAAAHHNSAYASSGYELLYPASSLSAGAHTVTVVAVDSGGRSKFLGPVGFTVQ